MIKPNNNQRVQTFRGSNCRGTYCIYNAKDNGYYSEKSGRKQKDVMRWNDATITETQDDDFEYVPEFAAMLGAALKEDRNKAKADYFKSEEYKQRKANGDASIDYSDNYFVKHYKMPNSELNLTESGNGTFDRLGREIDALVGKKGSVKPVVEAIVKSIREERKRSNLE